ncbi:M20/M25/M40 family metallo-hydrolase [Pedobacter sp. SYP-B3415]|uniref:M20/M25/M40 family metallo-hydrolase n=1 Tax=Pedobacter sp. SYP-B3415 TaxID=2496641 RepID=UPI00101C4900|nr:M20/M25/M40 family metallo-hydrolase [Pedobacter sp. SYP-B3415]
MKKLLFALSTLVTVQVSAQQKPDINQIISKEYADRLIKTLSADEMQGRATFGPGIDKAATFIESEFKKIGLQPLAGLKGYRQTFYKYRLSGRQGTVTVNGKPIDQANIAVIGSTTEKLAFDAKSGAPVTVLDTTKEFSAQYRQFARAPKKQLVIVPAKFAEAFKRIRGFSAGASVVDEKDLNATEGGGSVFVLGADPAAKDFSVNMQSKVEKLPLFNVAGMIPGKSKKQELVIFSGHYDHIGIQKAVGTDSIANGADDDASGTTAVIALAKYYKALKNNERTLIFVAFTAEEIGGFGARYFSNQLNPDDVVAMFNIEMIGKDSKFGPNTAFITGFEKSDFGKILQKNLAGTEFSFHPDPYPQQNLFYRSDNATLAALGVPAHTISTVQIDGDKLYHTVKDEYSSLDVQNILATIRGIAKSAVSIVAGKDTPTRIAKLQ